MKYLACIGLEMHCEISKTNTKVFSSARNKYDETANVNVRPVDMAFPGTLPVVNKKAIELALMASIILNCKQPDYIYFERKNYYYPDLPKGFQITQESKPIPVGIYGSLSFKNDEGDQRTVRINNIHLEEDSASLDHFFDTSTIDYNRAGVPLLELVTEPDIHSADDAVSFLETIRSIYQYANISEADSKKGQIRCDVNVSIMDASLDPLDQNNWGTKVEIKNVNSFSGVRDTINYEIKRQTDAKENGTYNEVINQETRRWDEETQTTIFMRSKVDAIDYKYFVEPNIPKYKVTNKWLETIKASIPELPLERKQKYIDKYNLSEYDAGVLIKEKAISDYFEECLKLGMNPKISSNWITVNIIAYLNKNDITIDQFYLTPELLKQILDAISSNNISSKQAKEIFTKSLDEKKEPKTYISKDNAQINDITEISNIIKKIIADSPNQIIDYHNGKTNLFDYFVGQVMKQTRGKANPTITKEILNEELNK